MGWFDITGQEVRLRELGIDPRRALTELHLLDEHQHIRSGTESVYSVDGKGSSLKPLVWFIGRPPPDPTGA